MNKRRGTDTEHNLNVDENMARMKVFAVGNLGKTDAGVQFRVIAGGRGQIIEKHTDGSETVDFEIKVSPLSRYSILSPFCMRTRTTSK